MDPQAINFNSGAIQIDTSCLYPTTTSGLVTRISNLPSLLDEGSALLFTDNRLFTVNDGGNTPDIFEIDSTSGIIKKTTRISNYNNSDWEELAADQSHIYIGDFGNNDGDRTNLRILKIKKSDVYNPDSLNITAQRLRFDYPDQTSFTPNPNNNFDCEAFFYFQNRLHLFTKNRGDKRTKHYSLNPNLANQTAVFHRSFNVNGLITSASIRADGKVVTLLGLDQTGLLPVFSWLFFGYEGTDFFSGNRRRIELPASFVTGQAEGICFAGDYRLWISNERLSNIPPRIRQFNIGSYIQPFHSTSTNDIESNENTVFPNPSNGIYNIELTGSEQFQVYNALGSLIQDGYRPRIDLTARPKGIYHLIILNSQNGQILKRKTLFLVP